MRASNSTEIDRMHDEAMDLAQRAFLLRAGEHSEDALELAIRAFQIELEAAERFDREGGGEPARSVLYRSAASLAYQARAWNEAERVAHRALSGYPSARIRNELKALIEMIDFERTFRPIDASDLTISVDGPEVSRGGAAYHTVTRKVGTVISMYHRLFAFMTKVPFDPSARPGAQSTAAIPVIQAFSPGSFQVHLKMAIPSGQTESLFAPVPLVVDQLARAVQTVEDGDSEELERIISDDQYRENFLKWATDLSPDGERLSVVRLITQEREVSYTRTRDSVRAPIRSQPTEEISAPQPREATGFLVAASIEKSLSLGLAEEIGKKPFVTFEAEDTMGDIVNSYFQEHVTVTLEPIESKSKRKKDKLTLVDIAPSG